MKFEQNGEEEIAIYAGGPSLENDFTLSMTNCWGAEKDLFCLKVHCLASFMTLYMQNCA